MTTHRSMIQRLIVLLILGIVGYAVLSRVYSITFGLDRSAPEVVKLRINPEGSHP